MNKDERSDVVGSKVDMNIDTNNVYLLKPKLRGLRIDYRVFLQAFGRDVDFHDHYRLTTYLDLKSGKVLWVYENDDDAPSEGGFSVEGNITNRVSIDANPKNYLVIPGLTHVQHHEILREFLSSPWTDDSEKRRIAEWHYDGSIGRWVRSVDDEARDAFFYDFRESKFKEMAEEFPNRNRDVVVVGGGMGGLTAAIQAQDCGAQAIVIEKSLDELLL